MTFDERLKDFCENTVVRVTMTVEQASDIYASLLSCAEMFRKKDMLNIARRLERLADGFLGKSETYTTKK